MRPTLNIVGAGKVARTLARLWSDAGVFEVQDVYSRTPASTEAALAFMGTGRAASRISDLRPAQLTLIGTSDDALAECAAALGAAGVLIPEAVVFHCSGARTASVLQGAGVGALASVHPAASFAVPADMLTRFAGTWCALEGDAEALAGLEPAVVAIGARTLRISARDKPVYHAGAIFASNYLVSVIDAAVACFAQAGIAREAALELMAPLARGALDNALRLGPQAALTGPIARGDVQVVRAHHAALLEADPTLAALYRALAARTAQLAQRPDPLQ